MMQIHHLTRQLFKYNIRSYHGKISKMQTDIEELTKRVSTLESYFNKMSPKSPADKQSILINNSDKNLPLYAEGAEPVNQMPAFYLRGL